MAVSHAQLTRYRHAPRKVRLVADYVRGKYVDEALTELDFIGKRAARGIKKLIESARANAHDAGHTGAALYVHEICVDEGPTMFRRQPRAQGRANVIRKRTSRIYVALDEKQNRAVTKPAKENATA